MGSCLVCGYENSGDFVEEDGLSCWKVLGEVL